MKQSKGLRLQLTENWALNYLRKIAYFWLRHESKFSDKQKFHIAPKQRHPLSTEVLIIE